MKFKEYLEENANREAYVLINSESKQPPEHGGDPDIYGTTASSAKSAKGAIISKLNDRKHPRDWLVLNNVDKFEAITYQEYRKRYKPSPRPNPAYAKPTPKRKPKPKPDQMTLFDDPEPPTDYNWH